MLIFADEREREFIRDMLEMAFEVKIGAKVSLKDVVRHIEIRYTVSTFFLI